MERAHFKRTINAHLLIFLALGVFQADARTTNESMLLDIARELFEITQHTCPGEMFCSDFFPWKFGYEAHHVFERHHRRSSPREPPDHYGAEQLWNGTASDRDDTPALYHGEQEWDEPVNSDSDQAYAGEEWNTNRGYLPENKQAYHNGINSSGKCYCDPDCIRYGDCCVDASIVYSSTKETEEIDSFWTCLTMPTYGETKIYMIGKCPSNWATTEDKRLVEAQCERKHSEEFVYNYLLDIPVLSLRTNRIYANVYCATCHADASELENWDVTITCSDDSEKYNLSRESIIRPENYHPGTRQWFYEKQDISISCILRIDQQANRFLNYDSKTNSRKCRKTMDKCHEHWPKTDDQLKCDSYTALVYAGFQLLKNPHCAKCNFVSVEDEICSPLFEISFAPPREIKIMISFSMIFDFGFTYEKETGRNETCNENEIFDHLHNQCQFIVCGKLFAYNGNGTCVPRNVMPIGTSNYLNDSCHRHIILGNKDYVNLKNGSIWLNSTEEVLGIEEFELMEGGGNVSICADRIAQQNPYFRYSVASAQHILSDICLIISVICLALHIGIHIVLPELRNLPGKNLLSLSFALFFAQLLFLIGMGVRDSVGYGPCAVIGIMTHWFYLAAFFWMNIMGFDICRTFTGYQSPAGRHSLGQSNMSTFFYYSLYAWSVPTVIVVTGLILDFGHFLEQHAPSYGTQVCWISNRRALGILFVLPVAVIMFANFIMFIHTVRSIMQQREAAKFAADKNQSQGNNKTANYKIKFYFLLYVKLSVITGLGWLFGFLAAFTNIPALWYLFILFNGLQGSFIFVSFDCKRKIYNSLRIRASRWFHSSDSSPNSLPMPQLPSASSFANTRSIQSQSRPASEESVASPSTDESSY